jgi:uncharacterized protein YkwD
VLPRTCVALAAAVALAGVSVNTLPAAVHTGGAHNVVTTMPSLDSGIVAGINAARARHGLARLRVSVGLRSAARAHSLDMARHGFFSHDSRDGTAPGDRFARFYGPAAKIGEALLEWSPGVTAGAAVQAWLSSPEHRAILLDPGFRELGVSAVHATAGAGEFHGSQVTLVTADFGAKLR